MLSCFTCVQLCTNLWTVACQAPLSRGFSRQEYWSGLPLPFSREAFQTSDQTLISHTWQPGLLPPGKPRVVQDYKTHVKVKVAQSCPTLWDHMDYTVHGILQARILEWVAFPFSRGSSQPRDLTQVSHTAGGFFTSWATGEAQEYWSGNPILSPADLPDPGIEPGSPADFLPAELSGRPQSIWKSQLYFYILATNNQTLKLKKQSVTIESKHIKYLGINLTKKNVKDLYTEHHKTRLRKIKDDLNKWTNIPCSWAGRLNIVKMSILFKLI